MSHALATVRRDGRRPSARLSGWHCGSAVRLHNPRNNIGTTGLRPLWCGRPARTRLSLQRCAAW